jgi:hypothetical protein
MVGITIVYVHSTNSAPFSVMLHAHYTITINLYHLALNFYGRNMFFPQNKIALQTSLRDQVFSVIAIAHQLTPE